MCPFIIKINNSYNKKDNREYNIIKNFNGLIFNKCQDINEYGLQMLKNFEKGMSDYFLPYSFCIYESKHGICDGKCQYTCHYNSNIAKKGIYHDDFDINFDEL